MGVDDVVEEIIAACGSMVGLPYDGEPVDQLEDALQCAALAREAGGERDLVVAALLHDIARAPAVAGIPYDGPATDPSYAARLTDVSARTLQAQGGPMTEPEIRAFEAQTDWTLAVELRRFDDAGKVPGAEVPGLDAYRADLAAVVAARG